MSDRSWPTRAAGRAVECNQLAAPIFTHKQHQVIDMNRRALRGLILLLICGASAEMAINGFTLGSPCAFGFGPRQQALREALVRKAFSEPLPADMAIEKFECGGFQDFYAGFTLRISNVDARALLADLDTTFNNQQNHPSVSEKQKRRHAVVMPDGTKTSFVLPGVGMLDFRNVDVQLPDDTSVPAVVTFDGSQL